MAQTTQTPDILLRDGVLSQKKIFEHLYGYSRQRRAKAGSILSAPIVKSETVGNKWELVQEQVKAVMDKLFFHDRKLYYFIEIMMAGALRVSEAINIRPYDITMTGLVKIISLKKGNEKIIASGAAKEYMISCRKNNIYPFDGYSRFFIYREFKKIGMPSVPTGYGKHAVTHLFRHLQVASLKEIEEDKTVIKKYLGHKSIKSQDNYGQ